MARFEAEVGCDISAGADWGIHLDKVLEMTLNRLDQIKLTKLLSEQLEKVLARFLHGANLKASPTVARHR